MFEFAKDLTGGRTLYVDHSSGAWVVSTSDVIPSAQNSVREGTANQLADDITPVLVVYKLTHKCNFACSYCYDTEYTNKLKIPRRNRSVRTLLHQLLYVDKRKVGVVFHGGEPLLHFDEIRSVVSEFRNPKYGSVEFGIQTNGSRLTPEILEFLRENRIGLSISLDGSDAATNYIRGPRVFNEVYERLLNLAASGDLSLSRVSLTMTIGAHNVSQLPSSILDFQSAGFGAVSFSPIHVVNSGAIKARPEDVCRAYTEILDLIAEKKLRDICVSTILQWVLKVVTGRSSLRCISRDCGAGKTMKVVTPNGNLVPCDSIFDKDYEYTDSAQMDDVMGVVRNKLMSTRYTSNCINCGIRSICPGPCPGNSFLDRAHNYNSVVDECAFLYEWITVLIERLSRSSYGARILDYCNHHRSGTTLKESTERKCHVQN